MLKHLRQKPDVALPSDSDDESLVIKLMSKQVEDKNVHLNSEKPSCSHDTICQSAESNIVLRFLITQLLSLDSN